MGERVASDKRRDMKVVTSYAIVFDGGDNGL
jgi:hypothetical protein